MKINPSRSIGWLVEPWMRRIRVSDTLEGPSHCILKIVILREFDARILRPGPGYVILDGSAFYPESGGQPSDTGVILSGRKSVRVNKVVKRGGEIYHYVDGVLPTGGAVHGILDWDRRYLNMRRHSCEHPSPDYLRRLAQALKSTPMWRG